MMVNQLGLPVWEQTYAFSDLTLEDRKEAVDLLFKHLKLELVRTNATEGRLLELQLRPKPT